MSKEKVEQFKEQCKRIVGGAASDGALNGLCCAASGNLYSYLDRSIGARLYPLQKKYGVKIVGVCYDRKPYSCFYKVEDLETNEIEIIQIV